MTKYNCPCCGYPTLDHLDDWPICILCDWTVGQETVSAEHHWPNEVYDLDIARQNFQSFRTSRNPKDAPTFPTETASSVQLCKSRLMFLLGRAKSLQSNSEIEANGAETAAILARLQRVRNVEWGFAQRDLQPTYGLGALVGSLARASADDKVDTSDSKLSHRIASELSYSARWINDDGFEALSRRSLEESAKYLEIVGADKAAAIFTMAADSFDSLLKGSETARQIDLQLQKIYRAQENEMFRLVMNYLNNYKSDFLEIAELSD